MNIKKVCAKKPTKKQKETIDFMLDYLPGVEKIKYNYPATILWFKNGGKVVVKHRDGKRDLEKAILYGWIKHVKGESKKKAKEKVSGDPYTYEYMIPVTIKNIEFWLGEFFDRKLNGLNMVVDASCSAKAEIDRLRKENERLIEEDLKHPQQITINENNPLTKGLDF